MSDLLKNAAPELYEALRDLVNAGHPEGMRLPAYRRAEELLRRLPPRRPRVEGDPGVNPAFPLKGERTLTRRRPGSGC